MIRVERIEGKGRGIVATRDIAAGELIETAPVLVIPNCEWEMIDVSFLFGYIYLWGDEVGVGMGLSSFYNHSYSPNAFYVKHLERRTLEFRALRPIPAGEEIVINYNGDPTNKTPFRLNVTNTDRLIDVSREPI